MQVSEINVKILEENLSSSRRMTKHEIGAILSCDERTARATISKLGKRIPIIFSSDMKGYRKGKDVEEIKYDKHALQEELMYTQRSIDELNARIKELRDRCKPLEEHRTNLIQAICIE